MTIGLTSTPTKAADGVLAHLAMLVSSWLFVLALHWAHATYLQPVQEEWGFPYFSMGLGAWLFLLLSTGTVALTLPPSLARPSSLVMFVLYLIVFLPTVTITLAVHPQALSELGASLSALTIGFIALNLILQKCKPMPDLRWRRSPTTRQALFFALAFLVLWVFVVLSFKDVMTIAGLDDIYEQREAGRSRTWMEAYAQTYLAYVFSPALLAFGLTTRRPTWTCLALLGFITMYAITAERTIFLLPFIMALTYWALGLKIAHTTLMSIVIALLALMITVATQLVDNHYLFELLALYFVFRIFSIPGAMLWQYNEVFSGSTYTFWSHIKGFDLFMPTPLALHSNPNWPQLGHIVAEQILERESNSNAHLFVYDGLAANGPMGILVIFLLLGVWLSVVDRTTRLVDWKFACLAYIPMAFVLANGSMFSALLSFGGLFWLGFFGLQLFRTPVSPVR
ncbi:MULTISPECIES: oligosaccharide repeat unit polymerase [Hydrogenophaga]|uniref:O-antigen polymerase n=1 Tax=Hydrogenophaga intermedia TaxID=65786 RepID=A0A1L1PI91_HYDIT|nr:MULTISPECIES: oligosaccharide repeat unit polymerase [Hydrogenophaga]TMU74198.1 oligosaccharide repeat unit polymerase [Hydrogenophaga intermedia]CDN87683.1 hypothetical protein BN948_02108 [Hydrogenophaga intermedia]